ncbi:alkane 1-monooxygenase [Mycobacterium ulcerans]|uniref:Transmembrane alkane 1-monooxygenase AlkB_1 n=1 Tax=Mycobacterium ulcerans (strain Agy99) TaxID=362242 RepID=A0PRT9_MYCUA|nr:alkane 1-monooxygenase [Mycobacterium ulcerans]ABL05058.1 transmembrane alkane 1-monooxygenase AlkB_1 [Mycobacterium ulcerans Agy99]MEB3906542.1 alkane 1-monooxygenase [Mycobacterium ulcerans]MEB3910704.1 alkane 1-monooxygenase [Mycobacterium ulcerans]MEB3920944.1 alkane 1-monooxygenase [Mycobacterium ulcerans]MEB3925050.1 alkane 1-monooxygenase [Mycobacterium ulcerans]
MTSVAQPKSENPVQQRRDRKRYLWLVGLVLPTALPASLALAWVFGKLGWTAVTPVLWWIGPFLLYLLLPALDVFFGPDGENPPDEVMERLENDKYYRYCTYAFIPLQMVSLVLACYLWSADNLSWLGLGAGLGLISKIGLTMTIGVVGGVGINTAHELGHKRENLEGWLSKITLAQTLYGHFYIEHNRGHHVRVATPEDPASARFGESFWMFLPRSMFGSLKSAWELEKSRMQRINKPTLSMRNDVLNAWIMSVVLFGALTAVFGWQVLPFLIIQGLFGASLLESVNYLEHYGLLRQRTASGRYERCAPVHSWNSDHIVTNIFLYHLQRHSDHHANPLRRYQTLRSMDGAPNLPSGYATLITLTYFPPLWRKLMDHRVIEHYDGDITKVNIDPRKRDKILATYGVR